MRSREKIEKSEADIRGSLVKHELEGKLEKHQIVQILFQRLILEVLLDIRELIEDLPNRSELQNMTFTTK